MSPKTKMKGSAALTIREAARMLGWHDKNATDRLTSLIRRKEKASGFKVLEVVPTEQRTRLMITLAGLRKVLPHLFVTSDEHLPTAISERFTDVDDRVAEVAARGGAHGSAIRCHAMRLTALEAIVRKLQSGELRLVKGGLK